MPRRLNTGDADTGWQCLKFSMSMPIYYRYQYNKGTGYLAPSVAPWPERVRGLGPG